MNYEQNYRNSIGGVASSDSMRGALNAPVTERDTVQNRLNSLDSQLDVLAGAIGELESTLTLVLSEPLPQKEPNGAMPSSAPSALMHRVALLHERAHMLTMVVQSITRRVTL